MHRLTTPSPALAVLVLVRSVKAGAPVATSSLRKSRERGRARCCPRATYMRVLPFGSVVTAIAGRVWITAAFSDGLICVHVAPASFERQTPRAYEAA